MADSTGCLTPVHRQLNLLPCCTNKVNLLTIKQRSTATSLRHYTGALLATTLLALSPLANALIEYTETQQDTVVELIEQLEERHYAKLSYDDELSSQHLDNYIDSLDGGKMQPVHVAVIVEDDTDLSRRLAELIRCLLYTSPSPRDA